MGVLTHAFTDARERTMAIGIWGAVTALSLGLGPVVGGVIDQHIHWGWIFLINVPIGVITFAVAVRFVAESRARESARRLDMPGLVTSAIALTALTYALIEGHDRGWTSALISRCPPSCGKRACQMVLAADERRITPVPPAPVWAAPVWWRLPTGV